MLEIEKALMMTFSPQSKIGGTPICVFGDFVLPYRQYPTVIVIAKLVLSQHL